MLCGGISRRQPEGQDTPRKNLSVSKWALRDADPLQLHDCRRDAQSSFFGQDKHLGCPKKKARVPLFFSLWEKRGQEPTKETPADIGPTPAPTTGSTSTHDNYFSVNAVSGITLFFAFQILLCWQNRRRILYVSKA